MIFLAQVMLWRRSLFSSLVQALLLVGRLTFLFYFLFYYEPPPSWEQEERV
jgi:hypothetical protein